MVNPTPTNEASTPAKPLDPTTPLRCFTGALISGSLGVALYFLTISIIQKFAHTPLPTQSAFSINIAIAVRTLVIGVSTLATGLFGFATIGLVALGIQIWLQKRQQPD